MNHNAHSRLRYICAAAFLCVASSVSAQTHYKHSALDVEIALASNSAISSQHAVTIDANDAKRRLGQAQRAREQGAEPLPGEQTKITGASGVNDRYWRRQEKLRHVVEQAQRRSNETRRPQLANATR